MPLNLASLLLIVAIIAVVVPPGYPAYIGAYVALVAGLIALLTFGWRERLTFVHPVSLAILLSVGLVTATVLFVHHTARDLLAPILILPMLTTIALGLLARPAGWVPSPVAFALICLVGSFLALLGVGFEHFVLGTFRPGLGNNPIHFGSLAAMGGCLALVGVVASSSPWRYLFLLGPLFALAAASIADSRGPAAGALAMTGIGLIVLIVWLWRETLFRLAVLAGLAAAALGFIYLASTGNTRVTGILQSGLDVYRFTGGPDDIRAALYASAFQVLKASPVVGVGLGQIMLTAQDMFPDLVLGTDLENLHADWANFAAMAGSLGLLAWLSLLAAPLLLLLDSEARRDRPIVLGAVLLTTGQLVLGISNATFGILPQTMIYAVMLGYFLVRARRLPLLARHR